MKKYIPFGVIIFSLLLVTSMFTFVPTVKAASNTFYYMGQIFGQYPIDETMHMWAFPTRDYIVVTSEETLTVSFLDVSDPESAPVFVSSIKTEQYPRYGYVPEDNENYCFVGCWDTPNVTANFTVIDVSDINNPVIHSNLLFSGWTPGGLKYVESIQTVFMVGYWGSSTLTSIDVSSLSNPVEISTVVVGTALHGLWVNETRAVLLGYDADTIYLYDVSDTSNMVQLDSYNAGYLDKCQDIAGLNLGSGIVVIASQSYGISIWNISTDNFVPLFNNDYGSSLCTNVVLNANETVAFVGTHSPATNRPTTVYAYDMSNPSNPSLLDTVTDGDEGCTIRNTQVDSSTVKSNYYYVGTFAYNVANSGVTGFRFGDIIPETEPPAEHRILDIYGQENNTDIITPDIYVNATKNILLTYQRFHVQIGNSSGFPAPFLNLDDINETNYGIDYWENSTRFKFTVPNGIDNYGATPNIHYYRYRTRYKVVTE